VPVGAALSRTPQADCASIQLVAPEELPAYSDLILPTVRAVSALGGSATAREITSQVLTDLAPTEEMLAVTHPHRPNDSVLIERLQLRERAQG
jgi:restriction system protein